MCEQICFQTIGNWNSWMRFHFFVLWINAWRVTHLIPIKLVGVKFFYLVAMCLPPLFMCQVLLTIIYYIYCKVVFLDTQDSLIWINGSWCIIYWSTGYNIYIQIFMFLDLVLELFCCTHINDLSQRECCLCTSLTYGIYGWIQNTYIFVINSTPTTCYW